MAKGAAAQDDGLNELRADLAEFVLREAGTTIADRPDLPLSGALIAAISTEVGRAIEAQRQTLPSAADLAEGVLRELRPELGALRAARGDDWTAADRGYGDGAAQPERGLRIGSLWLLAGVAVVAILAGGIGGYALAGGFSPPAAAAPTPAFAPADPLTDEAVSVEPVAAQGGAPGTIMASPQSDRRAAADPAPTTAAQNRAATRGPTTARPATSAPTTPTPAPTVAAPAAPAPQPDGSAG